MREFDKMKQKQPKRWQTLSTFWLASWLKPFLKKVEDLDCWNQGANVVLRKSCEVYERQKCQNKLKCKRLKLTLVTNKIRNVKEKCYICKKQLASCINLTKLKRLKAIIINWLKHLCIP